MSFIAVNIQFISHLVVPTALPKPVEKSSTVISVENVVTVFDVADSFFNKRAVID